MKTIDLEERAGADKLLRLTVPVDQGDRVYHVSVVIHDDTENDDEWPPGFFEETAGSLSEDFVIEPEGPPQERNWM